MDQHTKRGRPRSKSSKEAIINSTIELIESVGYEKLKIVDIAKEAGVGKQTIYRWWKSKAELVIEAVLEDANKNVLIPDTGSLIEDLRQFISASCTRSDSQASRNMLSGLLMAGRKDAETLKLFRESFIETRRSTLRQILLRHQKTGQIGETVDLELILDLVYGPMWYRLLVEHAPLDVTFANKLIDVIEQLLSGKK